MTFEKWCRLTDQEAQDYKSIVSRKIKNQRDIEPGDLVRIAPWCANKFRIAHVTFVAWYDKRNIGIQYLDEEGLKEGPGKAIGGPHGNLELIDDK